MANNILNNPVKPVFNRILKITPEKLSNE